MLFFFWEFCGIYLEIVWIPFHSIYIFDFHCLDDKWYIWRCNKILIQNRLSSKKDGNVEFVYSQYNSIFTS